MITKTAILVLACAVAYAAGNPAIGVEWRWPARHVTVTPNVMSLPWEKIAQTYVPKVRIPGYKKVENCGPVIENPARIVGGNEAVPHSYPWMAAIFIDDAWFCGGSIISEEWILTAAHCMDGARTAEVVLGAQNIDKYEASQVTVYSTDFTVHEYYNPSLITDDLALIHLSEPITFTTEIQPVCMPAYSTPGLEAGELVNPSGWGTTSDNDFYITDVLREVTVPVMSNRQCKLIYGPSVTDNTVCVDTTGGMGICSGDSGGPLNHVENGISYIRGISSYGSSAGCETGYPNGFSRVSNYLDWIETNTGIAIDP
uniref:Transmembrane protease serine 9-like n=1 Tax=Hirondellea gigas TaxID=1518452 RepID=A0A6A7FNN4_9CRUS